MEALAPVEGAVTVPLPVKSGGHSSLVLVFLGFVIQTYLLLVGMRTSLLIIFTTSQSHIHKSLKSLMNEELCLGKWLNE